MRAGEVVRAKSIVCQMGNEKLRGSVTQKAYPDHQLMFLFLGAVNMKKPEDFSPRAALKAMGWIPGPALQAEFDAEAAAKVDP